jgi:hypothetical protein
MTDTNKKNIRRTIGKAAREKGRFPSEVEMCGILSYTSEQTHKYMKALEEDGVLVKKGNWYDFPEEAIKEFVIEEKHETPVETVEIKLPEITDINIPEPLSTEFIDSKIETDTFSNHNDLKGLQSEKIIEEYLNKDEPIEVPVVGKKKFKFNTTKIVKTFDGVKEKIIKQERKPKEQRIDWVMWIIKWGMGIVGACALILSAYYNSVEARKYLPSVLAVIFSGMVVLFSVSSFETMIYIFSQRNMKKWIKTIIITCFAILFLTGVMISMSSVVAGRYSKYTENQLSKSKEVSGFSNDQFRWQEYEKQKILIQQRISEKQGQLAQLYKITGSVQDIKEKETHGGSYAETQWRITNIETEMKKLDLSLNDIRTKEHDLLMKNPELISSATISTSGVATDFHSWLSGVLGIDKNKIQFFLALFPSFLIDLLSPIAIAISLFLRKRK